MVEKRGERGVEGRSTVERSEGDREVVDVGGLLVTRARVMA